MPEQGGTAHHLDTSTAVTLLLLLLLLCRYSIKVHEKQPGSRRGRKTLVNKDILKGLTGVIQPGRLTAVMGASGAGKTTFLNVLVSQRWLGGAGAAT